MDHARFDPDHIFEAKREGSFALRDFSTGVSQSTVSTGVLLHKCTPEVKEGESD